jgi:PAS domain S-box-containing protein
MKRGEASINRSRGDSMEIPEDISKEQLINNLARLRQRIHELERTEEDRKKYLEELNSTKAMFEGLFEFAPDGIIVVDGQGRIVRANKQLERMFGYSREELSVLDHDVLLPERYRDKHREHRAKYMSEPRVRPMGTGLELYGRRKDGSEFPVDISLGVLKPLSGENDILVLAVIRDFTERKQAEEKLRYLNKELEAFAHAVSHDLKAPLRRIEGFIQILSEDYAEKLDDRGRDYLHRIVSASRRMQNLTDALLGLSRFAFGKLNRSAVYLSTMVKAAAADLAKISPQRKAELIIADDVKTEADPSMIRIVIDNLVGNAWKFTEKRPVGKIEFGTMQLDGKVVYFIRDNGAGFNMEYADRLFNPFQRLHADDEFSGLGIGLATVQRIIQRHGGRIWAEGEVDKGATFYFTLN